MKPQHSTKKKIRKHRVVKNGLVDLDDVVVAPGTDYQNWTSFVKTKIKVILKSLEISCSFEPTLISHSAL